MVINEKNKIFTFAILQLYHSKNKEKWKNF